VVLGVYSFLDVFWTMLIFFCWIIWFFLLFRIIVDIFRRDDISGWAKTGWLLFVIVLPFIGVFTYLIVHSGDMAQRDVSTANAQRQEFDTYVRSVADGGGPAAEIDRAKQLLDSGAITQTEFETLKAKALA
jgi:hypothetical protein